MPRACLRNARSLASASSPLLPFLAPRAFAEAPSVRRNTRYDDDRSQKEQEKKKDYQVCSFLNRNVSWSPSVGARYADIFSFARYQLRSYSTEGSSDRIRKSKKGRPEVEKRRSGGSVAVKRVATRFKVRKLTSGPRARKEHARDYRQDIRSKTSDDSSKTLRPLVQKVVRDFTESSSPRGTPTTLFDQRRRKRLALLRRNIALFERYEAAKYPHISKTEHGKYRSLQRRVFNYETERALEIDLDTPFIFHSPGFEEASKAKIMKAFAALDREIYPGLRRRAIPVRIKHHSMCAPWTARLFDRAHTSEADQVWRNWSAFDVETREQFWPHLLLYLLQHFPARTLPFIQALTYKPCVKSLDVAIIADAFEHLGRICADETIWKLKTSQMDQLQRAKSSFIPVFHYVFRDHLSAHKRICSQDLLLTLAKLGSVRDLQRIFNLLKDSDAYMGYDVLLHYANTFAKAGDFRQSLACLRHIAEGAGDWTERMKLVNERRYRWSCALVLHRSMMNRENYHETTDIVAVFAEFGVKFDLLLYNVIIHNAMEAGDYSTAFKVYNTLEENGLKPNKITFSTLLYGCTITGDPAKFHDFAQYCAETAKELKDPWLAADYLYYLYVRLRRSQGLSNIDLPENTEVIYRAYSQFFSTRPLEPFWSAQSTSSENALLWPDNVLAESAFMKPPPMALYMMLQLEILKAARISNEAVWTLYSKFIELVRKNHDPVLIVLAQNPIIWNAFLLAFCRAKQFTYASQLVKDMTDHGPQPNIYTWNIFMQAFFKSQQVKAAERVSEIMRSRGIEPDQFTYEVLLRGYARGQHVQKIGHVMEHVGDEEQVNARLLRDLARVHDRKRIMVELEQARARKEQREEVERAEKAERDKAKWKAPSFSSMFDPEEKTEDVGEMPHVKSVLPTTLGMTSKRALRK
ncbi:hypothetical protein N0V90_007942 [Kalmusia sp. IMI 367209]|nr:hypothetical protein N0V90_007942 [Kalmusia sp. IMI 367209]